MCANRPSEEFVWIVLPRGTLNFVKGALAPLAAFTIALAITVAALASGFVGGLEKELHDGRDRLRVADASGEIAIVEVDGRSLQKLPQWPWPRSHYADAILELDRLGAKQIAFDIEFSARSMPEEDARFASALEQLGGAVILPTFRQFNQATKDREISEALPIPELREHAFLASVNVFPDADGRVVLYPHGVSTNGVPRPSLASMVSGSAGSIDERFRLDQAINPASFERISFVDLIENRVSESQVAGKRILIGSTAIELGDRYPTALFGVQPGVLIHAQAAETLIQDRIRGTSGPFAPFLLAAIALLACIAHRRARRHVVAIALGIAVSASAAALALDRINGLYIELGAVLLFAGLFMIGQRLNELAFKLRAARLTDLASKLPNRRALEVACHKIEQPQISVARIEDFEQLQSITASEDLNALNRSVASRLGLMAKDNKVYLLGGGLFGWIIEAERADELADHFSAARALFNAPLEAGDRAIKLSACFGSSAGSVAEAISASDYARRRGLRWSAASADMAQESQFRQAVLGGLDKALESGEISVLFQPKMHLATRQIRSAECLVRWDSPTLGKISPADFVPVLEQKGQMDRLTLFVLAEAIERSRAANRSGLSLNLAVNLSAQLLSDGEFIDQVVEMLRTAANLKPRAITLEITESAPLEDPDMARNALEKLYDAGARISIDDYGTGHATLNYLKDFPAHEIKLDQAFVRNFAQEQASRVMVRSTVELAHALNFELVAEGVEDQATLEALAGYGCDYAQGWQVGKPMAWRDLVAQVMTDEVIQQQAAQNG